MHVDPLCVKVIKDILPAVRAGIAEKLSLEYKYKQEEIAEKLGIAQAAVSKYLNKKYSKRTTAIKEFIIANGLLNSVIKDIISGEDNKVISKKIYDVCTSELSLAYLKNLNF